MLWKIVIISLLARMARTMCPSGCICIYPSIDCSLRHLTALHIDPSPQFFPVGAGDNPLQTDKTSTFISLNLAYNNIEDLPTLLLSENFPHLQSLDLSHNKLKDVTKVQSVVLSREMLHLKLSSNPIKHLGYNADTVIYSQSISHLDMSDCDINSITSSETLMYMMNLTSLNLSGNPLVVIDHLFSSTLALLDLSHCILGLNERGIREETLIHLSKLKHLNLSFNAHLTTIFSTKPLSYTLSNLEASYCALEKLDLKCFPNLQHATLKGNVIKTLNNHIFLENTHLQSLDISENSIHHIEQHAFLGANSLHKLDLSLNQLSEVDLNLFSQSPQLRFLNLSRNFFRSLHEIPLPSLTILDASKCDIVKLSPNFLAKAKEVKYLNLSYNSIEKLPKRLTAKKLLYLDLSFCRLSDLQDETFQEMTSLINLNLMGNRLTSPINDNLLKQLVNLKELNLLNNLWHCDCNDTNYRSLLKYISSKPTHNKDLQDLICHSPKELSGMTWEKGCFKQLGNSERRSSNGAWFSFLVPFLTLCCLLAILIVVRQAYTTHELELQQRELRNERLNDNTRMREIPPRIAPHTFDDDLERGIQMSVNDSTQRSTICELSKLPSYEEALLLPKLHSLDKLQNIIANYEESGRFDRNLSDCPELTQSGVSIDQEPLNRPSTSEH